MPDSVEATIARIVQHVPSRVSELRPDAPAGLDDVLARALAKDPETRHRDAAELATALRDLQQADEDELERHLSATVAVDFRDPLMAITLGVPDLATLDRAWREPAPEATDFEVDVEVPVRNSEGLTVADLARARVAPAPRRKPVFAAAAIASLFAVGGAYALFSSRDRERQGPTPVIVINGQISGADGLVLDAASALPVSEVSPSASGAARPAESASAGRGTSASLSTATRSDGVDGLTRAFSRQQPQVAKCFAANAAEKSTGTPEIAIRFLASTPPGRAPHPAQVLPAAVAATPLGACLAAVARATHFDSQQRDVSFRIPILAHRAP